MSDPSHHRPSPPPDDRRDRALLARKWAYLLSGVVVVPLSAEDLGRELGGRLDRLCTALRAEPFATEPFERAGEQLVALGYLGEPGLRCTMDVLGKGFLALPEFEATERFAERIVLGLGALACGFLAGSQRAVLEQQETMHLTLLKAVRDAKWNLRESEARFDEVVTSSASGVMIVDLDGRLSRANAAIGEMLGYTQAELTGAALLDFVHPDSTEVLREAIRSLREGERDRIRQSQRLLRKDGDVARISLTVSLLRGTDNQPSHFVTVVEDGTELMLLQSELSRQALHDVLTGLPNRQYFTSNLENALRRADPAYGTTLFQLRPDAFDMVCNSLGRQSGERLLVHVAQRLKTVLAREKTMIARFDGDEFAVLIENSATTPGVAALVAAIKDELAEPAYVDGRGLAVSVSVGVVHRPPSTIDPAELLRAADLTLRRAAAGRRGQWELYDPERDAAERDERTLAVSMPGAWEHGEISVWYRPVARLADGGTAGVEALLRWAPPELDPLPHKRCVRLAEETGLSLPLGDWLLRTSGGQIAWWRQRSGFEHPLLLGLTAHQACDGDLVSRVNQVLTDVGLRPEQLLLGMPAGVLPIDEAVDNLTVLADLGVRMLLDDFDLGPAGLTAVEDLPLAAVRVRSCLTTRLAAGPPATAALVPLVRQAGATVIVDGIADDDQARWWHAAGADLATGDFFGVAGQAEETVTHFN
ncbi:putative bifunctional diguanylate cyclase/phosphodiesterase [Amycolatopsis sp. NPDC059027]|uniref:putative bifunctional diguanylate cyclase/phosphodiesterase n=1 Tax=unclassified Amycolatopsis TaxID=2618356 RepID=UPI00366B32C6